MTVLYFLRGSRPGGVATVSNRDIFSAGLSASTVQGLQRSQTGRRSNGRSTSLRQNARNVHH